MAFPPTTAATDKGMPDAPVESWDSSKESSSRTEIEGKADDKDAIEEEADEENDEEDDEEDDGRKESSEVTRDPKMPVFFRKEIPYQI